MTTESPGCLATDKNLVHKGTTHGHAAASPREDGWLQVEKRAMFAVLGLTFNPSAGDQWHREALESSVSVYSAPARRVAAWVTESRPPAQRNRQGVDVRALVEAGRVAEARGAVRQGSDWASLLRPPLPRKAAVAAGGESRGSFAANALWVRDHREDARYAGQWVALLDGSVVLSDLDRSALQTRLKERGVSRGVLVVRMGGRL